MFLFLPTITLAETKGIGGLEGEPPAWDEFANVLANPGFESGTTGWNIGSSGCVVTDEIPGHSGSTYSLKCPPGFGYIYQNQPVNAPRYVVRGWMRTAQTGTGYPLLYTFDATRGTTAMVKAKGTPGPLSDWTQFSSPENTQYLPSGATTDTIQVRFGYSGALNDWVYFDDIELRPLVPILRTFLTYPNFRGLLWADTSQIVTGVVEAVAPEGHSLSEYDVVLTFKTDAGVELSTTTIPSVSASNRWSYDASKLAVDAELLISARMRLKTDRSVVATFPDWRVVKKSAASRTSFTNWFDTDNFLVRNGTKHFVIGAYDRIGSSRVPTGHYSLSPNITNYLGLKGFAGRTLINSYADTRLNTLIYWSPMSGATVGSINAWADALDTVNASHMHILQDFHDGAPYRPSWAADLTDTQLWTTIATGLNKNTLGFYVTDEPDYQNRPTVSQIWNQYAVLRANAKDKPTLGAMFQPGTANMMRYVTDIIASDIYPWMGLTFTDYMTGDNVAAAPYDSRSGQWTKMLVDYTYGSRPVWAVLQLFQVYNSNAASFPSYDLMRRMAWSSIVNGANGIMWWCYGWGGGLETQEYVKGNAQAYLDLKRINNEIMDLEPMLVSSAVSSVSTTNSAITLLTKIHPVTGKIYAMAFNNSPSTQSVTFTTPSTSTLQSVSVYSESRSIKPDTSTTFTDAFAAHDVHVYELSLHKLYVIKKSGGVYRLRRK